MFASAFLLPAMGVVCLVSAALGLFGLVMYTGYLFTCYAVGLIWGSAPKRDVRGNIQQGVEQAQGATQRATGSS